MPTRKTADANIETAKAAEPAKKRSSSASKGSTSPAATHKRTAVKKAKQPSAQGAADPVVVVAAVETVSEPVVLKTASDPPAKPTHEQIAALAYSYWQARGYQGGSSEDDWLRAEHELAG